MQVLLLRLELQYDYHGLISVISMRFGYKKFETNLYELFHNLYIEIKSTKVGKHVPAFELQNKDIIFKYYLK